MPVPGYCGMGRLENCFWSVSEGGDYTIHTYIHTNWTRGGFLRGGVQTKGLYITMYIN